MISFDDIISNIWVRRVFWSVITILISVLIYSIISRAISNREKRNSKVFASKKNHTFIKMLKSIIRYILIILDFLIILQIFGVDVSSMLAGVGIIGIIIGFAIQDALKDIIKGFDIISDNYYRVGDVIKYGDTMGKVLAIGLKTTRVQDLASMNIVSIANRNIDQVEIVSDATYVNIPLPYELKIDKAEEIIDEIITEIKKLPDVKDASYIGLTEFASSALEYQIKIISEPTLRRPVRRASLGAIVRVLESHHVSIPYTQLDIHQK